MTAEEFLSRNWKVENSVDNMIELFDEETNESLIVKWEDIMILFGKLHAKGCDLGRILEGCKKSCCGGCCHGNCE